MTSKVDWVKFLEEQEKVTNMVSDLEVSKSVADANLNAAKDASEANSDAPGYHSRADASLIQKIIRKGLVDSMGVARICFRGGASAPPCPTVATPMVDSKNDIEVQKQDPNSPFYSVKTFEALHLKANLLKGVYEMGFNAPSKIQETALPILLADPPQNLIAQSQSGTGKTVAFILAMLSRVNPDKHYPQVLCLLPTYELAIQTGELAAHMAKFCPEIELKFAVRGEEMPRGAKLTEHIIIGTPGKVLDWGVKFRAFDLSKITVFVLDEADVMVATQGHQDQCIRILKCLDRRCQMIFFSMTYDQEVMEFAEVIVPNPLVIRRKRGEEILDNIKQYYINCASKQEKYDAVMNVYEAVDMGQAIIFCHTRRTANWLAEKMTKDGHAVAVFTGDLTVKQRVAVLDRFRSGQEKVLITTNVLSRGINAEQVRIVVNFDLPVDVNGKADCETYLYRIGRTGRFGKKGIAINLVDSSEAMAVCQTIERHFNKKIKFFSAEDSDEIEKIAA